MVVTSKPEAVRVAEQSVESSASAVEWAAIVAGALGAIGISIILFTRGSVLQSFAPNIRPSRCGLVDRYAICG
jgi:hypothetical protein